MVLKSKGGKKVVSVKSTKNKKLDIKYHRKDNYKKKKVVRKEECVICYNNVDMIKDNTIQCGGVNHILCAACKLKMQDNPMCPMCRSHNIRIPKQSHELLVIFSKSTRFGKGFTKQDRVDVFREENMIRPRHLTK